MEEKIKEQEVLKVSEQYKKAYNHADLICNHMPELLDKMPKPKGEPSDYTRGFTARVTEYRIEKDAAKKFSYAELKAKYGKELEKYDRRQNQSQSKGKRK